MHYVWFSLKRSLKSFINGSKSWHFILLINNWKNIRLYYVCKIWILSGIINEMFLSFSLFIIVLSIMLLNNIEFIFRAWNKKARVCPRKIDVDKDYLLFIHTIHKSVNILHCRKSFIPKFDKLAIHEIFMVFWLPWRVFETYFICKEKQKTKDINISNQMPLLFIFIFRQLFKFILAS